MDQVSRLTSKVSELTSRAAERDAEVRAAESRLDELRHALQERESSLQTFGELRLNLQWQISELTREKGEAVARASQMETLADGAGKEAEATAEDRNRLREQFAELETARQDLEAQLADTRHTLRTAQSTAEEIAPLRVKIQALQSQIAVERTRTSALEQKTARVKEDHESALATVTRAETALAQSQETVASVTADRDKIQRALTLARGERDTLQKVLSTQSTSDDQTQTDPSGEPAVIPAKSAALQGQLAQVEAVLRTAEANARHREAALAAAEVHAKEADNRAWQLEQRLKDLEAELQLRDLKPAERDRRQLDDLRRRFPNHERNSGGRPSDTSPAAHQALAWVTPPSQRSRIPLGSQSRGGLGRGAPVRRVVPQGNPHTGQTRPPTPPRPQEPSTTAPPVARSDASYPAHPRQHEAPPVHAPPSLQSPPASPRPPRELRKAFDANTGVYSARKTDDKDEVKGLFGRFKRRR